jgi:hypothetical protein
MPERTRTTAEQRELERRERIVRYARQVVADAEPMTDDERQQVIALLRPSATRLRVDKLQAKVISDAC